MLKLASHQPRLTQRNLNLRRSSIPIHSPHKEEIKLMSEPHADAPALSPLNGFLILLLVIVAVVGWIALGGQVFGVSSFFASFLFLWMWAGVEKADFNRWLPTLVGALVGIGLAWGPRFLTEQMGTNGTILSLILIVAALYVQVMNWVPIALNASCMLYLTVFGAPALLAKMDMPGVGELAIAVTGGAIYFAILVKIAFLIAARRTAAAAP
jgi:hypothetical protein